MNTEANQDRTAAQTTGERLRSAREAMGMTQKNVAERLCLKLSTVREIEEDKSPAGLASIFLRGYIRSYARLVRVPEEELLPALSKQVPSRSATVTSVKGYALGNRRRKKRRDMLLTTFTLLILFVVTGLTVAWWWQKHKAVQAELTLPSSSSDAASAQSDPSRSLPVSHGNGPEQQPQEAPAQTKLAPASESSTGVPLNTQSASAQPPAAGDTTDSAVVVPPSAASASANPSATAPSVPAETTASGRDAAISVQQDTLAISFNADCWIAVTDATSKSLFSGMQHVGATLNLSGKLPYHLKIGAPAAVTVKFRGQPVDLSGFIRRNQVASLTVGAR